jgi:hypothetical protein
MGGRSIAATVIGIRSLLDHAAFGRNRPNADNVIDSKSLERALREKPVPTFSWRALPSVIGSSMASSYPPIMARRRRRQARLNEKRDNAVN